MMLGDAKQGFITKQEAARLFRYGHDENAEVARSAEGILLNEGICKGVVKGNKQFRRKGDGA